MSGGQKQGVTLAWELCLEGGKRENKREKKQKREQEREYLHDHIFTCPITNENIYRISLYIYENTKALGVLI